jgi:hypothetical protein
MKTFYLLCIIGLLFSACNATSHVPCMPSEPMFTGPLQAQASMGNAFDHIEGQAAVAVLPFLGFTCDYYAGTKGIKQFEYGANLFTPLNKKKTWFVSLSAGKGEGSFKGHYATGFIYTLSNQINSEFNSFYIQPAVYLLIKQTDNTICKFSFSLKHEEIFFKQLNIAAESLSNSGTYVYTTYAKKDNGYAIINTPFIGLSVENKKSPIYFQTQLGSRYVTKGFQVTITHHISNGSSNYGETPKLVTNITHPLFSPFMLNMTVGLKLDYFRWKKNKSK